MLGLQQAMAALAGALTGGLLSVVASWVAQRVQTEGQWLTQEIQRRQQLYSEFIEAAARCYADALHQHEPVTAHLTQLYAATGRMRLQSTEPVIEEAERVIHKILETHRGANWNGDQIRDFLAENSVDLFSDFGLVCRTELRALQAYHRTEESRTPASAARRVAPASAVPLGRRTHGDVVQP